MASEATRAGRVLSLQRHGGKWLAVVQAFSTTRRDHPILSELVPVDELKGVQRRKVSRWLACMGAAALP
jgi:hypothetical protein